MNRMFVSAVALLALAGAAHAQIQFQIVERTGQTEANASDNIVELAVQARVTGGAALGGFDFNVAITGESESAGVLSRLRISNNTGVYNTGWAPADPGSVGLHGLARQYCYLAGLDGSFNGLINVSGGTFTNNPGQQEIGLITGKTTGTWLLGTPGVDDDGNGYPITAGNASATTGALPAGVGPAYYGQGAFVDVYRFSYTVNDLSSRTLHFVITDAHGETFTSFLKSGSLWGTNAQPATGVQTTGLDIAVTPAPSTVALMGLGGLVAARRRRA